MVAVLQQLIAGVTDFNGYFDQIIWIMRRVGEDEGLKCGRGNLMLIKSQECHTQTLKCGVSQSGSDMETAN